MSTSFVEKMETHSNTDQSKSSLTDMGDRLLNGSDEEDSRTTLRTSNEDKEAFAPAETKAVFCLKLVFLAILVASALAVAFAVFCFTTNSENDEFERHFLDSSAKVLNSVMTSLDRTLGMADTFAVSLVSFARYANMEWPFVTLPDYAVRAAKMRALANAAVVSTYPIVSLEQRERWEKYSLANDGWVREALDVQSDDETYHGKVIREFKPYGIIHDNHGSSEGLGPFLPLWQSAPIVPIYAPYNWDGAAYTALATALPVLLETKEVVISTVSNLPNVDDPESIAEAETTTDWIKDYIKEHNDPSEPMSDIFYPIVDTAADSVSSKTNSSSVVGILSISFFWRELIKNVLPPGSDGIVCVIENGCGQTFTYQIDGPEVAYLGRGDQHDSTYDYLVQSGKIQLRRASDNMDQAYTGLPLSCDRCPYRMSVYPSKAIEEIHTTNDPATFTVVAVLIFVLTSAIFLVYDRCVERRQKKIMKTAVQSTANVSLLEDKVNERTSKLQDTNERLEEANQRILEASAAQLQHFACMSHEIRTPLNCIIGLSSLLQETKLSSMQQESMEMIVSSSDLLLTVVNDVLDYSKLESGNVDIEIGRSHLQETLNSVVSAMEAKSLAKLQLSFRTIYDARIGEIVTTDRRRLQQILFNLLGNSVKFSKEGGTVELRVSLCSPGSSSTSETSYSPSEKMAQRAHQMVGEEQVVLRFSVKDYGQGLAQQDFEKIFLPFRQASPETESVHGGTGLGLAITTKLIHGLGGTITVDSEVGKWTEFSVDIPYDQAPADINSISAGLKHAIILFICDQKEIKDQMSGVFKVYGTDLVNFSNMNELDKWIGTQGNLSHSRSYLCVVQEDLYDDATYQLLSEAAKSILIMVGPNHSVEDAQGHYRSLVRVLPSVLMKGLTRHLISIDDISIGSGRPSDRAVNSVPYQEFHVLIAEDNLINQKVLLRILNRLGIENVDIVDNGKKAADNEAAKPYQVVLMDMQMPVMDGIDACKLIRDRKGGHAKATVVFVTAHASEEFEVECSRAGASGFIPKPFNIREIEKCFQNLQDVLGSSEDGPTETTKKRDSQEIVIAAGK